MNPKFKTFCVTGVFFIIQLTNFAAAQPVKLAWDSSSGAEQGGYNLYRSNRVGVYTGPPLNGSTLLRKPSFTDSTAQMGQTYYYAVTTVSRSGMESGFSNEVKVVVNPTSNITRPAGVVPLSGHVGSAIRTLPPHSSGMTLIRYEQNQFLVSEAAIRAAPLMRTGRTYVEFQHSVNTGVALVNSNPHPVVIDFYFTDDNGIKLYASSITVRPNANTIGFLNEAPFVPPSKFDLRMARTFTFSASAPIAVTALRGFTNERSEFIMTPLPVSAVESAATASTIIPYYTDGGPWKTRVVLTNPADAPSSGIIEVFGSLGGDPLQRLTYVIPSASAIDLPLSGAESEIRVGWIRITPSEDNAHPSALALLSFGSADSSDYEFGVIAIPDESAFRIYVESSGIKPEPGSVESSVVLTNSANTLALIHLDVLQMDGTYTGLQRDLYLPPNSQIAISDEIAELLTDAIPFKGFLRFSGTSTTAVGLKRSYNEGGQPLVTPMPAIPESVRVSSAEELFLFSANVPGYVTSLFVFDPR